jgi:ubiquitin-conjugating enzyme E2 D/E
MQGGRFVALLDLRTGYPFKPPSLQFVTKIYHPWVRENGEVTDAMFEAEGVWTPEIKLHECCGLILDLMTSPPPAHAFSVNEEML